MINNKKVFLVYIVFFFVFLTFFLFPKYGNNTKLYSYYIKEKLKLKSGSSEPGRNIVKSITKKQLEEIAKEKMVDLNAHDVEQASKIIAGSARSMGIEVKD